MRVLDLFAGLGGWSAAFKDRGHHIVTSDIDPEFGCTVTGDITALLTQSKIDDAGPYDIILASPPCEAFSVASIGTHWAEGYTPKTEAARRAIGVVLSTIFLIDYIEPRWWIMENPRGMLRKMPFMAPFPRQTVTYCSYGDGRMKPTDLWGDFPDTLMFRPMCKNGASCHESAPRGAKTGTQGIKGAALRAVVPYQLSEDVCIACEEALA